MRINTNLAALNTHRLMGQTNDAIAKSIGRLSSGFRINRAGDDAAGLAVANKFRADIRSLRVAQQNTTEATSMLQVAEGNASTISTILGRMKELATQASSYNSNSQLTTLNNEFSELKGEIDRIVDAADYQGVKLLDGSFNGTFQIGARNATDNQLAIGLNSGTGPSAVDAGRFADGGALGTITWGQDTALAGLGDGAYTIKAEKATVPAGVALDGASKADFGGALGVITWGADADLEALGAGDCTLKAVESAGVPWFVIYDGANLVASSNVVARAGASGTDTFTITDGTNLLAEFTIDAQAVASGGLDVTDADGNGMDFTAASGLALFDVDATPQSDSYTFSIMSGTTTVATATQADDGTNPMTFALQDSQNNALASFSVASGFDVAGLGTGGVADFFAVSPGAGAATGLSTTDLSLDAIDLTSATNAQGALDSIDSAIDMVNSFLGTIGATQNRLDYAAANIATTVENYSASESAIRDADMAFEMTTFTRNQIMQQAAMAMLAQANAAPQGVLRLLG
jgi:flagellin